MIDERDYDTPYPTEQDEDDVDRTPRILDNFIQLVKLCEILGDVLRDLYMVKGRKQLSAMATPDSVISTLDRALNQWMAKLPPPLRYKPPNTRMGERSPFPAPALELCQVHMLFYTTLILLHRPFIPGPTQSTAPSVFPSASICTFAANKILDIAESLLVEGRLTNVNNYSLYFMFTAGIIFIYNASSSDSMFSFEAKICINKIMRAMDEVEKTWITSARHCNILGELAGLRDINLSGIDETHHRRRQQAAGLIVQQTPASIAVPNSPVENNTPSSSPPLSPTQQQQRLLPLEQEQHQQSEGIDEKYANYYSTILEDSSRRSVSSTSTTSSFTSPSAARPTFDPLATEFWSVPMSFDFDEWNSYFDNQNPQRQQQQDPINTGSVEEGSFT